MESKPSSTSSADADNGFFSKPLPNSKPIPYLGRRLPPLQTVHMKFTHTTSSPRQTQPQPPPNNSTQPAPDNNNSNCDRPHASSATATEEELPEALAQGRGVRTAYSHPLPGSRAYAFVKRSAGATARETGEVKEGVVGEGEEDERTPLDVGHGSRCACHSCVRARMQFAIESFGGGR